ncbi:hypothetical protein BJX63DRAFT_408950 [Aspergillus granulosus]|uniref:C2H2 finger domain protein n=1 Tax=Aspergillus granulosus TaxID=176169 RepID=A0ABR4GZG5_9EURO
MNGHCPYPTDFPAYHGPGPLAMEHDPQLYAHDDAGPAIPSHMVAFPYEHDAAGKESALSAFTPGYPPVPPVTQLGSWHLHHAPFDGSMRSDSPRSDSQYSESLAYGYDDAVSPTSFECSPSPPAYQEGVSLALYDPEPMSAVSETVSPMLHGSSPIFMAYPNQQPIEYPPAASPTSASTSTKAAPKTSRKTTTTTTRRQSTQSSRVHEPYTRAPKKAPTRPKGRTDPGTTPRKSTKKTTGRRFECSFSRYGCTSTFPSKNEWKRHVFSQHIQLGFYRCDTGRCSLNNRNPTGTPDQSSSLDRPHQQGHGQPTPLVNDFNRKDLFTQHQRRMHAPWVPAKNQRSSKASTGTEEERIAFDASLEEVYKRCWTQVRHPPMQSRCGFCGQEFQGVNAWKERMEHVARHYEKGDAGSEAEDVPLREWAAEQGIIRLEKGEWKLTK